MEFGSKAGVAAAFFSYVGICIGYALISCICVLIFGVRILPSIVAITYFFVFKTGCRGRKWYTRSDRLFKRCARSSYHQYQDVFGQGVVIDILVCFGIGYWT